MMKNTKQKPPSTLAGATGSDLPAVGGRRLDCSNAQFEWKCLCALKREQEKIAPDNAVIAVLCDAVRCVREYSDMMQASFSPNDPAQAQPAARVRPANRGVCRLLPGALGSAKKRS
jgi:hypothetical protein